MENAINTKLLLEDAIAADADLVKAILDAPSGHPMSTEEFTQWLSTI